MQLCQGLTNTERRFMLNAERGDCASVAKIIEQQAALTEQGQQAVRDTSQDSLGGEQSILATVIISAVK